MIKVLTAEQMREVDRLTTERYGIPSILLMENAAHSVARVITEQLGGSVKDRFINVLAGTGNNGGDGAALTRPFQKDIQSNLLPVSTKLEPTQLHRRRYYLSQRVYL